jgi:Tfp pilus assembly protein PilW
MGAGFAARMMEGSPLGLRAAASPTTASRVSASPAASSAAAAPALRLGTLRE